MKAGAIRRARRAGLAALVAAAALGPGGPARCAPAAQPAELELERTGDLFTVHASALVRGSAEEVWQVLTDYDHIATFVPGIRDSHVVAPTVPDGLPQPEARQGQGGAQAVVQERSLVVEQKGALGLSIFPFAFEVTLRVTEHPPGRIDIERIAGSGRTYQASYRIEAMTPHETRLEFSALIESDRFIPPLIGTSLMHRTLLRQFEAVVGEVERRERGGSETTGK